MHRLNFSALKAPFFLAAALFLMFIPFMQPVHAHQYSSGITTLTLTKSQTELTFAIDELSAVELTGGTLNADGQLDQEQFNAIKDRLESIIKQNITLRINDEPAPWTQVKSFELVHTGKVAKVELKAVFPPAAAYQPIFMADHLYVNDSVTNYVNLLAINYGSQTNSAAIAGKDREWVMVLTAQDYAGLDQDIRQQPVANDAQIDEEKKQIPAKQQAKSTSGWYTFFELGMHHILSGYDHLLFLLTLLIARQTFRQYAALITAFTIAHSLTLTLTVLDVISVPAWIVEPAIAISICYVAVENVIRKKLNYRWVLTFAFGLIHGMGFADLLKEMNIPKTELAVDLVSFNLGIEAVQMMIVLIVLPLIYVSNRWKYSKRAMVAGSAAAFLLGGGWFVQRVFLG